MASRCRHELEVNLPKTRSSLVSTQKGVQGGAREYLVTCRGLEPKVLRRLCPRKASMTDGVKMKDVGGGVDQNPSWNVAIPFFDEQIKTSGKFDKQMLVARGVDMTSVEH